MAEIKKEVAHKLGFKSQNILEESKIYKNLTKKIVRYILIIGYVRVIFLILVFCLVVGLMLFNDLWLGFLAKTTWKIEKEVYVGVFVFLSLLSALLTFLRDVFFFNMIQGSTSYMHDQLVDTILKMKARWLTVFPVSRISYNASNDVSTLDYKLVVSIRMLFESIALTLAGLMVWNYIYYGVIMIVIALVGIYSVYILRKFLRTAPFFIRFIAEDRAKVREVYSETFKYAIYYRANKK